MSELIEKLKWRYAAKRMNGETVPAEKLENILESINLAPSSVGLQPYNVIVVENKELRERIFKEAAPQPQVTEASHLLVFAAWEKLTAEQITRYIELMARTRDITVESLSTFHNKINDSLLSQPAESNFQWAARQAYIGLGHALVAAAMEQVDATPMEGFNAQKMDEILSLNEKGLKSVVIMTLGYRDYENDPLVKAKKVRRPHKEFFITL